jgi:hypothetical protein
MSGNENMDDLGMTIGDESDRTVTYSEDMVVFGVGKGLTKKSKWLSETSWKYLKEKKQRASFANLSQQCAKSLPQTSSRETFKKRTNGFVCNRK